jgi:DNA repair exonuclease SbcCD nuclease subunit
MRLLCTGDIHLGRRPSRIPADAVDDPKRFSTSAGWEAIVELAIAEAVDLLLISGDLVDLDNRYYEAMGPVEAGLAALSEHGIPVVAVAGNHDYSTAPGFADRYRDSFHLLGRNQQWERHTIHDREGRPRLHIDGWSFANERVTEDPLASYTLTAVSDVPVIGLLHADVDATEKRYAPVRLRDLQRAGVTCWLLGHIHGHSLRNPVGYPPVLYPGSPVPLDPGETGEHGVWLLDIEREQAPQFTFRPIARHRYHPIDIDLTGITQPRDAGERVADEIRRAHDATLGEPQRQTLEYMLFRVSLIGTIPVGIDLDHEMDLVQRDVRLPRATIETIRNQTRPQVDLLALAGEKTPPGALARMILALRESPASVPLLADAQREVAKVRGQSPFGDLQDLDMLSPGDALEAASWRLLETLLAQRVGAS